MKPYEIWQLTVTRDEEEAGDSEYTTGLILHRPSGRLYCNDTHLLDLARELPRPGKTVDVKVRKVMVANHAAHLVLENRMTRVPILINEYARVQQYGGPEEGGWYYHTREHYATTKVWMTANPWGAEDLDQYGEGTVSRVEIIPAESENVQRQYYC